MTAAEFIKILERTDPANQRFLAQAQTGRRYYHNDGDIRKTGAAAIDEVNRFLKTLGRNPLHSADNRVPTNWHQIITDQKIGYLFTYPPQFDAGEEETNTKISEALGQDYAKVIRQLATDATNCGVGWLAYWYNPGEPFSYWFVDPEQVRVVFDPASVKPRILYLIRTWSESDSDRRTVLHYEAWDEKEVSYFISPEGGAPVPDLKRGMGGIARHTYGRIPFIPFRNNADARGDLPRYKELIDCIDKLVSGFANDIDDIQEIIWVIKNYAGETSETVTAEDGSEVTREIDLLQRLKAQKLVHVDQDGGVDTLRGEIPFEARSRFLEILKSQLYISAMAVDPFPDAVGQASGVYIDFLYGLLETKSGLMETEFRSALDEFAQAILLHLGISPRPVEQVWTRNKPKNDLETVQMISQTAETVLSDESKTKAHPLTEDWQGERKRIEAENAQKLKSVAAAFEGGDGE